MNICVFGASSERIDPACFADAQELGALIARGGHRLVFGAGREGLMGACARGVLQEGGRPLGIAPRFFDEPGVLLHDGCELLFTETVAERKSCMEAGLKLKEMGAGVIALGCTGLATIGIARELEETCGIPVIDPVLAEGLFAYFASIR